MPSGRSAIDALADPGEIGQADRMIDRVLRARAAAAERDDGDPTSRVAMRCTIPAAPDERRG